MVVTCHDFVQPGFMDRHNTVVELVNLLLIDVDAEDVITDVRQAGAGDQSDVTSSDDGEFHAEGPIGVDKT